jgi:hypothetical protein
MLNFVSKADSGSFLSCMIYFRSRDSLVGIAGKPGFDSHIVQKFFFSPQRPDRLRSTQPHIEGVRGAISPEVKAAGA